MADKVALGMLAGWDVGGSVLVLLSEDQGRAALSFRNLERVSVLPADEAGVADVLGAARLLVSESALADLTARLSGERSTEEAA